VCPNLEANANCLCSITYCDVLVCNTMLWHVTSTSTDFYPEDEGSAFLTNTSTYLQDYTASHPRLLWPYITEHAVQRWSHGLYYDTNLIFFWWYIKTPQISFTMHNSWSKFTVDTHQNWTVTHYHCSNAIRKRYIRCRYWTTGNEIKNINHLKQEGHLNNIQQFSTCLTVKTMLFHYEDWSVNTVCTPKHCFLW
jgi:hypothetical protein